jgi:transmembrane sensor
MTELWREAWPAGPHHIAASWHLRFIERPDLRETLRPQFEKWLASNPTNERAYRDVDRAWKVAQEVADDPQLRALREAALERAHRPRRLRALGATAATAIGALIVAALLIARPGTILDGRRAVPSPVLVYRSAIGQTRQVRLSDGTLVLLNTGTTVLVRYGPTERQLTLRAGEAYFDVAKDAKRPFRVLVPIGEVIAHGTRFDVRSDRQALKVALLQGIVSVRRQSRADLWLKPRQLLVATSLDVKIMPIADPRAYTSWSEGYVIFDNSTVADAAAELNRYSVRKIVIRDVGLARMRVSGTFRTGQSAAFVGALNYYAPVKASPDALGNLVVTAAEANKS